MKNTEKKNERPPVVVVLGHVDHGKTTLLDSLRKSSVVQGEAGGITQSIGASVVTTKNGDITFIDTPGHAAFSEMRSRGAKVADIALLIVACDDGIKPQTKEAIQIIQEAKLPFIVVATKKDISGVHPETVRSQLEAEGILFEGRGGDTPFVAVSARNNEGIEELLEMITLISEVNGLNKDTDDNLSAVVIESFKDKRGIVANLVVRGGVLKSNITTTLGRIRAIFDENGKQVKEVKSGYPCQVIGFSEIPDVGSILGLGEYKEKGFVAKKVVVQGRKIQEDELPILLKAVNVGALEAIIAALPPKVIVVDSSVGDVNESDVATAKVSNAQIFVFESRVPLAVLKLAQADHIEVKRFQIIYELIEEIENIFKKGKVETLGTAEILAEFPFNNKRVIGAKMIDGKIAKSNKILLYRDDKETGSAKISSLKKQKQEVASVGQGEEFGMILDPQLDFSVGDVLVSVSK